ncbi:hypothetical protein H6G72_28975 [Planktothricoides sp. FACHB-1370]|uniref:Transposase n=1 Tax=Planktothricoides raciborskii FACHB-1370 TaxID=2949576 RepID=A0ABR8EN71_9CYAN|nr:hypothetical protein [Planktothricoides raciborskii FACHB-1370]MBD2584456.1 hypothetical protein [Planktothricoides raciborskii FACHB-1261]
MVNSEKKPGFSYPRKSAIAQLRNRVSYVFCQIFGGFREETRFLMSQDAIAQPRNRVSDLFSPNFW